MHVIAVSFPLWLQLVAAAGLLFVLVSVLRGMVWEEIFVPGRVQHALIAVALLAVIWSMRAETVDGLAMHFLGAAVATLIFGWRLAILMLAVVVVILAGLGLVEPLMIPFTILVSGVLPVLTTWVLLRVSERRLPPHMFIYLYVVGFFGGALSVLAVMVANALLYGLFTPLAWDLVLSEYLRYTMLLVLPEGVLNGMIITGLVMFRPEWVATYSDARYVDGR
jgi:uncharacterized membrane protein